MLYWYSNIPEEVIYFKDRIDNHTWLMWGMFFVNFVVPMVLPGALGDHFHHIGLLEIGLFLTFLGVFMLRVLTTLTKAPLTPVNHPYLEESVHHHI